MARSPKERVLQELEAAAQRLHQVELRTKAEVDVARRARDRLIRQAVELGLSERAISAAGKISRGLIYKLKRR